MFRSIPPILASANITLNKESNPGHCLPHTHTHTNAHKETHTSREVLIDGQSLITFIPVSSCFWCVIWRKGTGINKMKHYINTVDLLYYPYRLATECKVH